MTTERTPQEIWDSLPEHEKQELVTLFNRMKEFERLAQSKGYEPEQLREMEDDILYGDFDGDPYIALESLQEFIGDDTYYDWVIQVHSKGGF